MAVTRQIAGISTLAYPFYVGKSTDPKPTLTVADATFYELDTQRYYVWKTDTWYLFSDAAAVAALATQIAALRDDLATLRDIRDECRATRLGVQERLNEGNAQQVDLLEMAREAADKEED